MQFQKPLYSMNVEQSNYTKRFKYISNVLPIARHNLLHESLLSVTRTYGLNLQTAIFGQSHLEFVKLRIVQLKTATYGRPHVERLPNHI